MGLCAFANIDSMEFYVYDNYKKVYNHLFIITDQYSLGLYVSVAREWMDTQLWA